MDERDQEVRWLLDRGTSKVGIAAQLGISRETVDRIAARLGHPAKRRRPSPHDWDAIRRVYEDGHSAAECMRRFGLSPSTWSAAIARGQISPRPRGHDQKPPGETRRTVERLLNEGRSITEIAERLGIAKPTVCYHARRLGVPARSKFARRYDWVEIDRIYESGVSMRECKRRFGFSQAAWAEAVSRGDIVPRERRIPLEDLLVVGRHTSRKHLKSRLLAAGLKDDRCEVCGIAEWLGESLSLQLHHKNGNGLDNRLRNLAVLCPNCHSQTDTYGGRNGHRRPELRLVKGDEVV